MGFNTDCRTFIINKSLEFTTIGNRDLKKYKLYQSDNCILLVGPLPPPIGGVSVYIKRLQSILIKEGFNTNVFFKPKTENGIIINSIELIRLLIRRKFDIIHLHGIFRTYLLISIAYKFLKKDCRIFFTLHNPRIFESDNKLELIFFKFTLKQIDTLIVVADHILNGLNRIIFDKATTVIVQNAFLPPPLEEEEEVYNSYLPRTIDFIERRKPLIIANAWQIRFYKGIDLYGLDLCIELTTRLKENFPKIGILFALADPTVNSKYISLTEKQMNDLKIAENFHIMTGQKELWPLFKRADCFIRPTATDGDSVSLREAIYFNCPVVASNVINRPGDAITFESRNIHDLQCKVEQILISLKRNADT